MFVVTRISTDHGPARNFKHEVKTPSFEICNVPYSRVTGTLDLLPSAEGYVGGKKDLTTRYRELISGNLRNRMQFILACLKIHPEGALVQEMAFDIELPVNFLSIMAGKTQTFTNIITKGSKYLGSK